MKKLYFQILTLFHLVISTCLLAEENTYQFIERESQEIIKCKKQSVKQEKYVFGPWPGGLAVNLHNALNHLLNCELTGKIPVAYWGKDSLYYTPGRFNGRKNAWEYYFDPVSNLKYKNGDVIHYYCEDQTCGHFSYYDLSQAKRYQAYQLINKYIRPNDIVQSKIDNFFNNKMAGKRTIGIHIRGTDKVSEEKIISPQKIVEEALKYADEEMQFFIATDEKKVFDELITLLEGKQVIYYECMRSEDGKPLHDPIKRERPSYLVAQNGEDVVVEMLLLSKCDFFIHTLSNVSAIPLYFNPELNHVIMRQ